MLSLNVLQLLSSPPAAREVWLHIFLGFPFSLWDGDYDKEGSEEADRAKEEVGVVDVEGLHKFLINKIKNSSSSEGPFVTNTNNITNIANSVSEF